jgi:hypothetical protein
MGKDKLEKQGALKEEEEKGNHGFARKGTRIK